MKHVALILFAAVSLYAQRMVPRLSSDLDIISPATWVSVGLGPAGSRPANCNPGQFYICVGVGCTPGNNIHFCSATNTWEVQGTAAGGGITSLNGLTLATQTFANDTNVQISSVGSTHTLTWAGTLAKNRQFAATVYTDQANTFGAFANSFAAASSLIIPIGAGLNPTANGTLAYDSTANIFKYGANGTTRSVVNLDEAQTLTNKTLTTPTIGSFANAAHNHQNAAGGGTLDAAAIASGTMATARLGGGTANATAALFGDSTWKAALQDSAANGFVVRTALGITTARTLEAIGPLSVTNGDGQAGNPSFSCATCVQNDISNSWADGVLQTFNPNGTNPGVSVGGHTGDPSNAPVGGTYYNTTSNKWRCVVSGAWADCDAGGGGGATSSADLTDCKLSNPSGANLSIGACGGESGGITFPVVSAATAALSGTSSTGQALFYLLAGVYTIGHNTAATITASGWTTATGITAYPAGAKRFGKATFTSNVWDAFPGGYTDDRRALATSHVVASGPNVTVNQDVNGVYQVAFDPPPSLLSTAVDWFDEPFKSGSAASNSIGKYGWRTTGTGHSPSFQNSVANHHGIFRIRALATIDNRNLLLLDAGASTSMELPGATTFDYMFLFRTSSTVTEYFFRLGWSDSTSVTPSNFIGVRFANGTGCSVLPNGSDTTLVYEVISGGTPTTNTTGAPSIAGNAWMKVRVRSETAGTLKYSSCSGDQCTLSSEQTISSGVPTGGLFPYFIVGTCSAAIRDLDMDRIFGTMAVNP